MAVVMELEAQKELHVPMCRRLLMATAFLVGEQVAISSSFPSMSVSYFVGHVWLFIYTPRPVVLHWGDCTSQGYLVMFLVDPITRWGTSGIHGQGCC